MSDLGTTHDPPVDAISLPAEDAREWWAYGDYTGEACPACSRERLMRCEDGRGRERVICEKCDWEPAAGTYRSVADVSPALDTGPSAIPREDHENDPNSTTEGE